MINLDETDKCILEFLQADAKMNIKEMAEQLNMTKTPIYERIRRLEQSGIIKKYVAIIDDKKVNSFMVVFCSVNLESQHLEKIQSFSQAVSEIPEVLECYLLGGEHDFLLKVVVKDLDEYHQFSSGKLAALPNVSQVKSTFVLNEVKHSTVFPID